MKELFLLNLLLSLFLTSTSVATAPACTQVPIFSKTQTSACEIELKVAGCEEFKKSQTAIDAGPGLIKTCDSKFDAQATLTCSPLIMAAGASALKRFAPDLGKQLPMIAKKLLPSMARYLTVLAVPTTVYTLIDVTYEALEKDKKCFEDIESKKAQIMLLKNISDQTRAKILPLVKSDSQRSLVFPEAYLREDFIKNISCSQLRDLNLQQKRKLDEIIGPLLAQNKISVDPRNELELNLDEKKAVEGMTQHFACLTPAKQAQFLCAIGNTAMSGKLLKDFLGKNKSAALKPFQEPYISAERLASNQKALRNRRLSPDERSADERRYNIMMKSSLARHQHLVENANGAELFHGSNSSSLLGLTGKSPEGLLPTGTLLQQGKIPFSGEVGRGVSQTGINQNNLSTVEFSDVDTAINYAKNYFNTGWNPKRGKRALEAYDEITKGSGRALQGLPGLNPEIEKLRLERWKSLSAEEKKIVQEGFPVLYGIAPNATRGMNAGMMTPALGTEVGVLGGATASEIKVIFVPAEKVELVQKLISPGTSGIRVAPIEPSLKNSWDEDQVKKHVKDILYPSRSGT